MPSGRSLNAAKVSASDVGEATRAAIHVDRTVNESGSPRSLLDLVGQPIGRVLTRGGGAPTPDKGGDRGSTALRHPSPPSTWLDPIHHRGRSKRTRRAPRRLRRIRLRSPRATSGITAVKGYDPRMTFDESNAALYDRLVLARRRGCDGCVPLDARGRRSGARARDRHRSHRLAPRRDRRSCRRHRLLGADGRPASGEARR